MTIVHIQTVVQATFGVLDDDGNVNPQQPVTVTLAKFSRDALEEAFQSIAVARENANQPPQI